LKCFRIAFRYSSDLSIKAHNALIDAFLRLAIKANGLQFGDGGGIGFWKGAAFTSVKKCKKID
jgi:uncharacterized protein YggL (DUF469 family)